MTFAPLRVLREDDGVAVVEYGLITAAIALVVIVTLQLTGVALDNAYSTLVSNWSAAAESGQ